MKFTKLECKCVCWFFCLRASPKAMMRLAVSSSSFWFPSAGCSSTSESVYTIAVLVELNRDYYYSWTAGWSTGPSAVRISGNKLPYISWSFASNTIFSLSPLSLHFVYRKYTVSTCLHEHSCIIYEVIVNFDRFWLLIIACCSLAFEPDTSTTTSYSNFQIWNFSNLINNIR